MDLDTGHATRLERILEADELDAELDRVSIAATKGATHRRKMGPAFGMSGALWRVCSSHS